MKWNEIKWNGMKLQVVRLYLPMMQRGLMQDICLRILCRLYSATFFNSRAFSFSACARSTSIWSLYTSVLTSGGNLSSKINSGESLLQRRFDSLQTEQMARKGNEEKKHALSGIIALIFLLTILVIAIPWYHYVTSTRHLLPTIDGGPSQEESNNDAEKERHDINDAIWHRMAPLTS